MTLHNESLTFSWESPEFEYRDKNKSWYWAVALLGLVLIALAIILHNYLFAFFVVLAVFLTIVLAKKQPLNLAVEISEQGIRIEKTLYPYPKLYAFWIKYNQKQEPILLLLSEQRVTPLISVIIDPSIDLMQLRDFLNTYIEEQEMTEPVTNRVMERIGF